MSSFGYGDYRDRDITGLMGTGVDAIQFPPPFPPLSAPHTVTTSIPHSVTTFTPSQGSKPAGPPPEAPPTVSPMEKIFGSMDRLGRFVVTVSRVGVVHCLAYPYIVFSRQCQVYPYNSVRPSLMAPLSTTAVLYRIAQSQGVHALWRGWKSSIQLVLVKPLIEAILVHIAASKNVFMAIILSPIWLPIWFIGFLVFPFRFYSAATTEADSSQEVISTKSLPKQTVTYIFVKGFLQASLLPLVSYVVSEMVRNTAGGVLHTQSQFMLERPFHTMDQYRRVPYLHLLPPSLLHEVTTDALTHLTTSLITRHQQPANDAVTVAMNYLWNSYISSFVTEMLLYPLETVLVRLYCQGMPGLVDNVQTGTDVMFISTYYSGVLDCIQEVWNAEGLWGFYKGFSSLLLRYAVHGALLVLLWRVVVFVMNRSKNANRR